MNLERDRNGRVKVYDVALKAWIWTQMVDARQGIDRGQFLAAEPKAVDERVQRSSKS